MCSCSAGKQKFKFKRFDDVVRAKTVGGKNVENRKTTTKKREKERVADERRRNWNGRDARETNKRVYERG